ncbi:MAG: phosphate ABC transporter permease subunit PstC [Deltaproteobacteria bacterium]|nr:phosphate ABC transporter permease subunit PstC [Deltaproteobacteria bacterium]
MDHASQTTTAGGAPSSLGQRGGATPLRERLIEHALLATGLLSIGTTLGIVVVLAGETLSFFEEASVAQLLLDTEWTPLFAEKHFGIWPLVSGTVLIAGIAMCVALPLGLLAAIYLSELAPSWARAILKPALEVLAGVPTIVYGYFALVVVTPLLQKVVPGLSGFNALSPGLVMGIMIIPMISSLSEDALHAVPTTLREGAWGLGASRLSTIFRVVLPAARSGVIASVILAVSRAIGETMIVAIAAGQQPRLTIDPRVPVETMTAYIVQVSLGDVPNGTLEYRTLFVVATCLFLLTLAFNLVGQRFARKARDL